jgi:hypothetical protein
MTDGNGASLTFGRNDFMNPFKSNLLSAAVIGICLLGGCASNGLTGLPGGAALVQEGGAMLNFTATEKGMLYLRDQPADRLIYQGPVAPGQKLELDATTNRITLEGRPLATDAPLRRDATYQVFFKAP